MTILIMVSERSWKWIKNFGNYFLHDVLFKMKVRTLGTMFYMIPIPTFLVTVFSRRLLKSCLVRTFRKKNLKWKLLGTFFSFCYFIIKVRTFWELFYMRPILVLTCIDKNPHGRDQHFRLILISKLKVVNPGRTYLSV
jgi:hypothetical protein